MENSSECLVVLLFSLLFDAQRSAPSFLFFSPFLFSDVGLIDFFFFAHGAVLVKEQGRKSEIIEANKHKLPPDSIVVLVLVTK